MVNNDPINQGTDTSGSNNFESMGAQSLDGTTILEVNNLVDSQVPFLVVSLDDAVLDVQGDNIDTVNLDGNTLVNRVSTPGLGKSLTDLDGKDTIGGAGKVKVTLLVVIVVLTLQGSEVRITPGVANLSRGSLDLDTSASTSPSASTNFLEAQDEASGALLGTTEGSASVVSSTSDDTSASNNTSTSNDTSTADNTSTSDDTASSDNTANDTLGTTAANGGTATNTSDDSANTAGDTGTGQTALLNNATLSGSEDTATTDSSLGSSGISNREAQGSN